ncbi:MAG: hypothetical protein NZ772_10460 [Cyanobacteria bacterium]|nr:hypothetical protein [Cyanobacteriota bacterium]
MGSVDIQRELNKLEELILDGRHIPLSRLTLVDEESLLDQLDFIRMSLPAAFHEAQEIVRHKEEIFLQAEQYAQDIIAAAERRAAQLVDELGIIQQAEMEARQLMQRVQQDCEAARQQMVAELERMERQAQQKAQEIQRQAIAERDAIQAGADEYADRTLGDIEQRLVEMLRITRNGRNQLQAEAASSRSQHNNASASTPRSST